VTLDGVFDAGTMERWFHPYHSDERGEDIKSQILACDALLLGRVTYEMLAPSWSSLKQNEMGIADKMNGVSKYVASSALKNTEWTNSTILKGNIVGDNHQAETVDRGRHSYPRQCYPCPFPDGR